MDIRERDIEYGKLWIKDLEIHPKVQREFRQWHLDNIVANWAPIAVNALTVVRMTSGTHSYYVIDGQHTLAALKKVGKKQADCKIIRAKSHAEMEEIFQIINKDKLRLSPMDKFLGEARNQPGSQADMINRIVERNGMKVSRDGTSHAIGAVVPLRSAFDKLHRKNFIKAVGVWAGLADNGHVICAATVKAIAEVIAQDRTNDALVDELEALFERRFFQIKEEAKSRCHGVNLTHKWRHLYDCILEEMTSPSPSMRIAA